MLGFIKKLFIGLLQFSGSLASMANVSCHTKRISSCKFDSRKCNSNQKWNNNKCQCECRHPRKHHL